MYVQPSPVSVGVPLFLKNTRACCLLPISTVMLFVVAVLIELTIPSEVRTSSCVPAGTSSVMLIVVVPEMV